MDEFSKCVVCARTPVVGEGVTIFGGGEAEVLVCDCCRRKPRARQMGEPVRRDHVRSIEGAANVRRTFPRPVRPKLPARAPVRA